MATPCDSRPFIIICDNINSISQTIGSQLLQLITAEEKLLYMLVRKVAIQVEYKCIKWKCFFFQFALTTLPTEGDLPIPHLTTQLRETLAKLNTKFKMITGWKYKNIYISFGLVGWDKMWINIYVGVDFSFKYIIYKFKLKPLIHVQISYNDDEILQLKKTFPGHQVCMCVWWSCLWSSL